MHTEAGAVAGTKDVLTWGDQEEEFVGVSTSKKSLAEGAARKTALIGVETMVSQQVGPSCRPL